MSDLLDKLPYTLTAGVTATEGGLRVGIRNQPVMAALLSALGRDRIDTGVQTVFPWKYLKPVLCYREGEPWCRPSKNGIYCASASESTWVSFGTTDEHYKLFRVLHRLAAILCDDVAAFCVLHDCIHNLSDEMRTP